MLRINPLSLDRSDEKNASALALGLRGRVVLQDSSGKMLASSARYLFHKMDKVKEGDLHQCFYCKSTQVCSLPEVRKGLSLCTYTFWCIFAGLSILFRTFPRCFVAVALKSSVRCHSRLICPGGLELKELYV